MTLHKTSKVKLLHDERGFVIIRANPAMEFHTTSYKEAIALFDRIRAKA